MRRISTLLLLFPGALAFSQTFSGPGGHINDNQTTNFQTNVSGLPTSINQTSFGLERICVNLNHTWDADLTISIVSPDGNTSILVSGAGDSGDNFTNTCFVWDAPTSVYEAGPPFTGDLRPDEAYGALNNNQNPNGVWKLRVTDSYGGDDGDVIGWSLIFSNDPAHAFPFSESSLPIVVLNTNGQQIPNEPKITAHMGIIYNGEGAINHITDPYNNYSNLVGIELRGSSSLNFPQKSYALETRDVNGTQHDTVLLGMPKEHDWILYAPYNDKTCMRNILSYHIANETGHYASRTKLVELVLNGNYKGIYVLMEKIKRDENRVNIAKLNPDEIDGDDATGGYIFKVDRDAGDGSYWTSEFPTSVNSEVRFVYVEPKPENIVPQQRDYIAWYVSNFENALMNVDFDDQVNGYRNFASVGSFVDYLILNEISKNVDGYRLSTFLYKDKNSNGGKLVAGPAWDYNLAWWNADYCLGNDATGWVYNFNDYCGGGGNDVPFWWEKLMEDPAFQTDLKCRWRELRETTLSYAYLESYIDSVAGYIDEAKDRHFQQWPLLGIYTWPNPSPIPQDYAGEITALKTWIHDRFDWMDENIPGTCYASIEEQWLASEIQVSPNPFSDNFAVKLSVPEGSEVTFQLYDLQGKQLSNETAKFVNGETYLKDVSSMSLPAGMYTLRITLNGNSVTKKLVKQQ
jgi:subtilisin-like proprotein convertase family protein